MVVRFLSLDHNVLDMLERRAFHDSAEFIASAMPEALALRSREALWDVAIGNAERHGLWLEFGVFKGYSINYLARRTDGRVFGFDSFHGLQEDGKGVGHTRGTFDLVGRLPREIQRIVGARLVQRHLTKLFGRKPRSFVSVALDCDTYEATAGVLGLIIERLTPKTVIIMDDYHGFWGYRNGQFRAWTEFVAAHGFVYRYAAFNRHTVLILNIRSVAP
jgi:hypothetical protein